MNILTCYKNKKSCKSTIHMILIYFDLETCGPDEIEPIFRV